MYTTDFEKATYLVLVISNWDRICKQAIGFPLTAFLGTIWRFYMNSQLNQRNKRELSSEGRIYKFKQN